MPLSSHFHYSAKKTDPFECCPEYVAPCPVRFNTEIVNYNIINKNLITSKLHKAFLQLCSRSFLLGKVWTSTPYCCEGMALLGCPGLCLALAHLARPDSNPTCCPGLSSARPHGDAWCLVLPGRGAVSPCPACSSADPSPCSMLTRTSQQHAYCLLI